MAFTNLLELAAEADRQTISEIAEKNPWLKKFAEQGEVLERLQPRLRGLYDDGSPEKVVTELENWRKWQRTDWVAHQSRTQQAQDLLAAAQAKIVELENRSDAEVTPEEIRQIVKETVSATFSEAGVVDNKKLEATMSDFLEKQLKPQLEANTNGLTSRFEDVYAALTPKLLEHKETFGETLKFRDVIDYMKKNNQMDPDKAYNEMVAPRLAEKVQKDWEAKLVEAEKRGEEKGVLKARAEVRPGRAMPLDGQGGPKVGPIQRAQLERFGKPPAEGQEIKAPLGKGVIAQKAAQEYFDKQNQAGAA